MNKATTEIVKQSNMEVNNILKMMDSLKRQFVDEFKRRMEQSFETVPMKYNKYSYQYKIKNGDKYGRYYAIDNCRKRIILNNEKMAEQYKYWDCSKIEISKDETKILFSIDVIGDEVVSLYYKFLFEDKLYEIKNPQKKEIVSFGNFVWNTTSTALYYITADKAKRPDMVWYYDIDTNEHVCVYEEKDEKFSVSVGETDDREKIMINAYSKLSSDVYLLEYKEGKPVPKCIIKREIGLIYSIEHFNSIWYILVEKDDKTEIIYSDTLTTNDFKVLVPNKESQYLEGMYIKDNYMLVSYRENGLPKHIVITLCNHQQKNITFKHLNYDISIPSLSNINPYSKDIIIYYETFTTPRQVLKLDLETGKGELLMAFKPKQYKMEDYEEKLVQVNRNGLMMTIIYNKKRLDLCKGPFRCVLYAYGAYGEVITPDFNKYIPSLLDRDYIYCIGHVRGGGFHGSEWYKEGRQMKKTNTFVDFATCAKYLIQKKYTQSDMLTIMGESAGGLTMGAAMNRDPSLYNLAILGVPFVDVVNIMQDDSIPLTTLEYEEWGDPKVKKVLTYMMKYSPLQNIDDDAEYPNVFIYTNKEDTRVQYKEPLRYYLKLRKAKVFEEGKREILFKMNMSYGHMQASNRYERLDEEAEIYLIIIHFNGYN